MPRTSAYRSLAGCFLPADIYVRYLRAQKRDVKFCIGSDEHGVPITIRAMKEGITPQDVVDKYQTIIKESFAEWVSRLISIRAHPIRSITKHHRLLYQTI